MTKTSIDGLLRVDFMEGIMAGHHLLTYLLLHKVTNERNGSQVIKWVRDWWNSDGTRRGWFPG